MPGQNENDFLDELPLGGDDKNDQEETSDIEDRLAELQNAAEEAEDQKNEAEAQHAETEAERDVAYDDVATEETDDEDEDPQPTEGPPEELDASEQVPASQETPGDTLVPDTDVVAETPEVSPGETPNNDDLPLFRRWDQLLTEVSQPTRNVIWEMGINDMQSLLRNTREDLLKPTGQLTEPQVVEVENWLAKYDATLSPKTATRPASRRVVGPTGNDALSPEVRHEREMLRRQKRNTR